MSQKHTHIRSQGLLRDISSVFIWWIHITHAIKEYLDLDVVLFSAYINLSKNNYLSFNGYYVRIIEQNSLTKK